MDWSRAWKKLADLLRRGRRGKGLSAHASMDPQDVKALVRGIVSTREDEIDCEQCFERLDRFVDLVMAGKNAAEALPLVQDHLNRCRDCREEFEVLLAALKGRT